MITPIETLYRGYRFRSRLEARWAIFLDAAGIEWKYEPQGYEIHGRRYLPDFRLPRLQTFVEVKPDKEAMEQAKPVLKLLAEATGHRGLLIGGTPNCYEPPTMSLADGQLAWWAQCSFCDRVILKIEGIRPEQCSCAPDIRFVRFSLGHFTAPRVEHAMEQAQRARFEHGEDGTPEPYFPAAPDREADVYVAGAVIETEEAEFGGSYGAVLRWREEIFQPHNERSANRGCLQAGELCFGRFCYGGPSIIGCHGVGEHGLAQSCLDEVRNADVFFAWIDRDDTVGTLIEIGAAYPQQPIFIAFATAELAERFYFAKQLATVAVIAPDALTAWKLFVQWRDREDAGDNA